MSSAVQPIAPRTRVISAIEPVADRSWRRGAILYVPTSIALRLLGVVRLLVIVRILGDAGQAQFGLFQPSLELINWLTPLVSLALIEAGERYAATHLRAGTLGASIRRDARALFVRGAAVVSVVLMLSPLLSTGILSSRLSPATAVLLLLTGVCAVGLAAFQWTVALLRGVGRYGTAAAMELASGLILFAVSVAAAHAGGAIALLGAYAISLWVPVVALAIAMRGDKTEPLGERSERSAFAKPVTLRTLIAITFGMVTIAAPGWLVALNGGHSSPQAAVAELAASFRLGQSVLFLAIPLLAVCYSRSSAIAAVMGTRRAVDQYVKLFGAGWLGIVCASLVLVSARDYLAAALPPSYHDSIHMLLPICSMLALWCAGLNFYVVLGDLVEAPERGAMLWTTVLLIQAIGLAALIVLRGPSSSVVTISAASSAVGAAVIAPGFIFRETLGTRGSILACLMGALPLTVLMAT